MKTKICTGECKRELLYTSEFFPKDCSLKSGLKVMCKLCVRKRDKIHYDKNKERLCRQSREFYAENREHVLQLAKDNKDSINVTRRKYTKRKRREDPEFRIKCVLKARISSLIGGRKNASTADLIGCSSRYIIEHLEGLFVTNMSWDNYGLKGWHVDHRKPCDAFNLLEPEDQRLCFNWRNLQPLWAPENLSKSNKWSDEDEVKWQEEIGRFI